MKNMECIVAVLKSHRDARGWTDEAVAIDLLAQLGLEADGDAKHAKPAVDPSLVTEEEVVAHEAAAQLATDKAKAARDQLTAQAHADDPTPPATDAARPRSHDPLDLAPATFDANAPPVPAPDHDHDHADDDDDKAPAEKTPRGKRS